MLFTVLSYLERAAREFPERTAIVDGDRSMTFAELRARARKTGKILSATGTEPGARVGICMEKSLEQVVAILGVLYANAVFVPILPRLKTENIEHIVANCGMATVIADAGRLHEVSRANSCPQVLIGAGRGAQIAKYPNLPELIDATPDTALLFDRIADDPAAIIYSSGSTGRPKGITISHRNLYDGAQIVSQYTGVNSSDRIAALLSFNFDYGLNQIWQTLSLGASLHLHEFLMPDNLFAYIETQHITILPVMPVFIANMFDTRLMRKGRKYDLSSVRRITTSGGPVSDAMISNLRDFFPGADIFLMYGLTEAFRSTYLPPQELLRRPRSIGKAIPGVEITVVDEHGAPCPPGVPGELVHRGGCMSLGYWNDEEANALRFRRHPALHNQVLLYSGDEVRTDEDGYLYFIGRKDEMIKTRGFRVSPTEIEVVANRWAGIFTTVAFGIEEPAVTQEVCLAYLPDSEDVFDEVAFNLFLKENLPAYMCPRHFIRLPSIGTTGNQGKFDRKASVAEAKKLLQERASGS
jgi:amino acid adenylation domain-containing protein